MVMIIRREVIHFAIKNKYLRLLGTGDNIVIPPQEDMNGKAPRAPQIADLEKKKDSDDEENFESFDEYEDSYRSNKEVHVAPFVMALKQAVAMEKEQKSHQSRNIHPLQINTEPLGGPATGENILKESLKKDKLVEIDGTTKQLEQDIFATYMTQPEVPETKNLLAETESNAPHFGMNI